MKLLVYFFGDELAFGCVEKIENALTGGPGFLFLEFPPPSGVGFRQVGHLCTVFGGGVALPGAGGNKANLEFRQTEAFVQPRGDIKVFEAVEARLN